MGYTHKSVINIFFIFLFVAFFAACNSSIDNSSIDSNSPSAPDDNAVLSFQKSTVFSDTINFLLGDTIFQDSDRKFHEGDEMPDLTLYTLNGEPFNLYSELENGLPVLFITGSYTCAMTRRNLLAINEFTRKYEQELTVALIFVVEPHPADTVSPYSSKNRVWLTNKNKRDSISADMPRTYKDRKELCSLWQNMYDLDPIVLVDSPENEFWFNYGQAPNMAYLIKPDRTIFCQQIILNTEKLEERLTLLLDN